MYFLTEGLDAKLVSLLYTQESTKGLAEAESRNNNTRYASRVRAGSKAREGFGDPNSFRARRAGFRAA